MWQLILIIGKLIIGNRRKRRPAISGTNIILAEMISLANARTVLNILYVGFYQTLEITL